jgi:hypothetical protein
VRDAADGGGDEDRVEVEER